MSRNENTTFVADPFKMEFTSSKIFLQPIKKLYQPFRLEADVLRLDGLHPVVSGNKWFKLSRYLEEAISLRKTTVLTFGGAYSNHIVATAAACQGAGLQSAGIIRGEEAPVLSPTLHQARSFGMQLFFSSRSDYAAKKVPEAVWDTFPPPSVYRIEEGGWGEKGKEGAAAILQTIAIEPYTHILAAVGTGTTLAGLRTGALPYQKIVGISVLKNNHSLAHSINSLLPDSLQNGFTLLHDYHFGGYAKRSKELIGFMNYWYSQTGIPSDFVYTAKLFYAADQLIRSGYFEEGSKILLLHSGGLQGNRSLPQGTLIFESQ